MEAYPVFPVIVVKKVGKRYKSLIAFSLSFPAVGKKFFLTFIFHSKVENLLQTTRALEGANKISVGKMDGTISLIFYTTVGTYRRY